MKSRRLLALGGVALGIAALLMFLLWRDADPAKDRTAESGIVYPVVTPDPGTIPAGPKAPAGEEAPVQPEEPAITEEASTPAPAGEKIPAERGNPRPKGPRQTRAEDQGEDFTQLPMETVLKKLLAGDRTEVRKAALVLGNKEMAEQEITQTENEAIGRAVDVFLDAMVNHQVKYGEAISNINRLWRSAAPALINVVRSSDQLRKVELAAECLSTMRNERIVRELLVHYANEQNPERKTILRHVLKKFELPPHRTNLPERTPLEPKEAMALYNQLIVPAVN